MSYDCNTQVRSGELWKGLGTYAFGDGRGVHGGLDQQVMGKEEGGW